jgi:hypothetical protein
VGSYVFRSQWRLPAPPDDVYAVLADVETYPAWWPQIRSTRRLDATSGELTCRGLVPHDLTFRMHRDIEDAVGRVLRARLEGDLAGSSQWTVRPAADGALAVFDENLTMGSGRLRLAGRFLRPVLRANHDLMMRAGEKGLRAHLRRAR